MSTFISIVHKALNTIATTISTASDKFNDSAEKISSLDKVYDRFYKSNLDFSQKATEILKAQNDSLEASYEKHFSTIVNSINDEIKELQKVANIVITSNKEFMELKDALLENLDEASKANKTSTIRNAEIQGVLVELANKLNEHRDVIVKNIIDPMRSPLERIGHELSNIKSTNDSVAEKMGKAIDKSYKYIDEIARTLKAQTNSMEDLLKEFNKSVEKIKKGMDDREERIIKQLEAASANISDLVEVINKTTGTNIKLRKNNAKKGIFNIPYIKEAIAGSIAICMLAGVIAQFMMLSELGAISREQVVLTEKIEMMTKKSPEKNADKPVIEKTQ